MPPVLHTEKYVRDSRGTELSKSKEWKMTTPTPMQYYNGVGVRAQRITYRRVPCPAQPVPRHLPHDTVHLPLRLL